MHNCGRLVFIRRLNYNSNTWIDAIVWNSFSTNLSFLCSGGPSLHPWCGGWRRVRHVPQGNSWHPARDNLTWVLAPDTEPDSRHLRGTEKYGDSEDDSQPWSLLWTKEEAEEFLFASGNMEYWLVVSREELIGADGRKRYENSPITVTASSDSDQPYQGDHLSSSSRSRLFGL